MVVRCVVPGLGKFEAVRKISALLAAKVPLATILRGVQRAEAAKDYEGAQQMYERGLRDHPRDAQLLNNFAWFLLTTPDVGRRDSKRGLDLASRAVERSKHEVGYILDTLAEALHQNGRLEEAVARAEEAARLDPRKEIARRARRFRAEARAGRAAPKKRWY